MLKELTKPAIYEDSRKRVVRQLQTINYWIISYKILLWKKDLHQNFEIKNLRALMSSLTCAQVAFGWLIPDNFIPYSILFFFSLFVNAFTLMHIGTLVKFHTALLNDKTKT